MIEKTFVAAPFFCLRTPLWSLENYDHVLEQNNWIDHLINLYESDALLREAIFIASPSLYNSLQQKPLKNPKQVALSLFNYVIRMATRPTPFGLFSCVNSGYWSQHTAIDFDIKNITKRARPDMEWVYDVTQKLYKDKEIFPYLHINMNPLVLCTGERYRLDYVRYYESTESPSEFFTIKATQLTKSILCLTKQPIQIQSLWKKLKIQMPFLDREKTILPPVY